MRKREFEGRKLKKALSILLAATMAVTMAQAGGVAAYADSDTIVLTDGFADDSTVSGYYADQVPGNNAYDNNITISDDTKSNSSKDTVVDCDLIYDASEYSGTMLDMYKNSKQNGLLTVTVNGNATAIGTPYQGIYIATNNVLANIKGNVNWPNTSSKCIDIESNSNGKVQIDGNVYQNGDGEVVHSNGSEGSLVEIKGNINCDGVESSRHMQSVIYAENYGNVEVGGDIIDTKSTALSQAVIDARMYAKVHIAGSVEGNSTQAIVTQNYNDGHASITIDKDAILSGSEAIWVCGSGSVNIKGNVTHHSTEDSNGSGIFCIYEGTSIIGGNVNEYVDETPRAGELVVATIDNNGSFAVGGDCIVNVADAISNTTKISLVKAYSNQNDSMAILGTSSFNSKVKASLLYMRIIGNDRTDSTDKAYVINQFQHMLFGKIDTTNIDNLVTGDYSVSLNGDNAADIKNAIRYYVKTSNIESVSATEETASKFGTMTIAGKTYTYANAGAELVFSVPAKNGETAKVYNGDTELTADEDGLYHYTVEDFGGIDLKAVYPSDGKTTNSNNDSVSVTVAPAMVSVNVNGAKLDSWDAVSTAIQTLTKDDLTKIADASDSMLQLNIVGSSDKTVPQAVVKALEKADFKYFHVFVGEGDAVTFDTASDNSKYTGISFAHKDTVTETSRTIDFTTKGSLGVNVLFHTTVPKKNSTVNIYRYENGNKVLVATTVSNANGQLCFAIDQTAEYVLEY